MRRRWLPFCAVGGLVGIALAIAAQRVGWPHLLLTPDQEGRISMSRGDAATAANAFRDPLWRGVALFRAGDFKTASQVLGGLDTPEGAYDSGNALVMLGKYDDAVKRYDRALSFRPGWRDAVANREIARIRAQRMTAEGGVTDNTESAPDEIAYDKTKKGGADATVESQGPPMSDSAIRAMWLKRVQTKPADFLRVKFSYQLQSAESGAAAVPEPTP